jgi:hypothetical protein
VAAILAHRGWRVEDVSGSDLGYDYECVTDGGRPVAVEVKYVKVLGRAFTLTSNEQSPARERRAGYCLAIVGEAGPQLEVAFVFDPTERLDLVRQCRKWAYECSTYQVEPERFSLAD